ncbi:hypothetical protein MMPV_007266 [Pyropia vietnamensis]
MFSPPVHVDDADDTVVLVRSSAFGVSFLSGDARQAAVDGSPGGQADTDDGGVASEAGRRDVESNGAGTGVGADGLRVNVGYAGGGEEGGGGGEHQGAVAAEGTAMQASQAATTPAVRAAVTQVALAAATHPRPEAGHETGADDGAVENGGVHGANLPDGAAPIRPDGSDDSLVQFYTTELMVAVGLTARMDSGAAVQGGCVHGANVLVVVELFDPVVTWTAFTDGVLLALCSCCGVLGRGRSVPEGATVEYPQMQSALGRSSTCRHATALLRAYDVLAREVEAVSYQNLFLALPMLRGPADEGDEDVSPAVITCFVTRAGRRQNVPVYAVGYNGTWSAVVIRPTSNKFWLATCIQLSCKSRPWGCVHAKAVNKLTRADASSDAARVEMARDDAIPLGPDGVLDQDFGEEQPAASRAPEGHHGAETTAGKPFPLRRSRNMFPCATEVKLCDQYSAALDLFRSGNECPWLERTLVESTCLVCGASGRGRTIESWQADVSTMRGRLRMLVGSWVCANGHRVDYDGAEDGLFAAGAETVYVRVLLDCVLGVCVVARSTMAAAAEYLTSVLRNTGAYADGEHGQTRQKIADAVGDFSETLIIPDVAFSCWDCASDEVKGERFRCVLGDGQILSVLQQYVKPIAAAGDGRPSRRHADHLRMLPVIRHRVRAGAKDAVAVTRDEVVKFREWEEVLLAPPPAPPPAPTAQSRCTRSPEQQQKALAWAAAKLFHKFFVVKRLNAAPSTVDSTSIHRGSPLRAGEVEGVAEEAQGDGTGGSSGAESDATVVHVREGCDTSEQQESGGEVVEGGASVVASGSTVAIVRGELDESARSGSGEDAVNGVALEVADKTSLQAGNEADGGVVAAVAGRESGHEVDVGAVIAALHLEAGAPGDGGSEAAPEVAQAVVALPSVPDAGDGSEFQLSEPADTDTAGSVHVVPEAADAAVPRTADAWAVPLASVEGEDGPEAGSDNPLAVHVVDPGSLLTRRALRVTLEALNPPNGDEGAWVVQVGSVPITRGDVDRLLSRRWLNDEVVNAMCTLMQWRNERTVAVEPLAPRHHFFNSYFFAVLSPRGGYAYERVQRWTQNVNVLGCDKLFFPVNLRNSHWALVAVDMRAGLVSLYDSLGVRNRDVCAVIVRWLADEAQRTHSPAWEWTVVAPWCRKQENADDCGVFMLQNMNYLAMGIDLGNITRCKTYYRRRMAAKLLARCIGGTG